MLKVPQKRFAHGVERVGILHSARGTGLCCFLSPLSSSSPPSADDALFLSLNLLPLPTEGATARAHPSLSHKLFPCSPHFHSQIGGGGPRHAHPLSQLDSTLDPFDELLLPLTSAMWPWLRGWINITRGVLSGDEAGPPAPIHGQHGPLFQPLPLLVLVGVDWLHRRVEKGMLDPAQSIHFTSTLIHGKVKGTLPSCFSLPSRTRIVVFNFVIFTDGPQRFPEFQCGLEWKPPL